MIRQNKNAVVRRTQVKTKDKERHLNTYTDIKSNDNYRENVHSIEIDAITVDDDPQSIALSIGVVVDSFKEGVIVFDNGRIHVYMSDLLYDIQNMAYRNQKEFSMLHEVYANHKTFLLYRNKTGNVMILPKTSTSHSPFQQLKNESVNSCSYKSKVRVKLKDLYKIKQNTVEEVHVEGMKKDNNEKNTADSDIISLMVSKKKIKLCIEKTISEQSRSQLQPLPRLPSPIPKKRIVITNPYEEHFSYPVQVSEDQRNNDQSHSERVVTENQSIVSNNRITYGFSPLPGFNHTSNSSVTSYAESASVQRAHSRPRIPPRYPNHSDYADRVISFSAGWPHISLDSSILSQAGFFFTKNGDLVRCFQCGIGLKDFSPDDDPLLEHVRHSEQCPFLFELLGEEGLAMYKRHLQTTDPEYNRQRQWHERQNSSSGRSNYRHPEYQTVQARISTFRNWPSQIMQRPEQLADAGLYYTGVEDHVRCFACDGGLRRWDPDDNPWTEHCRWFPACPYAIEQKGEQFIALVQASVETEGYEASGGADHLAVEMERLQETETPSLEEIIDVIDVIRERKQINGSLSSNRNESPTAENQRLKSFVFCMICGKNNINALFLPCTHHKLCMTCAEPLDFCTVCNRQIREKIRTYMA